MPQIVSSTAVERKVKHSKINIKKGKLTIGIRKFSFSAVETSTALEIALFLTTRSRKKRSLDYDRI
jgi:hypothetical protein